MKTKDYIALTDFCSHYGIDESIVLIFSEYELVQLNTVNRKPHVSRDQLPNLERMLRLHLELDINAEGLQAIHHLLDRVTDLQEELKLLKKRLERFHQ
ncbi:chaperone modulator CbpM [Spongiimicrobium sp. 2-473A-2-J]|uniref:chaperone modulator CbpM n=1 Tax=Eudoraea algarum TaxID=3417568 RepID=UPI003D360A74